MSEPAPANASKSTLRQRILGFVCALIVLSLLGSTLSLYRVTEVNRLLDAINGVSVPLGRLFVQLQSDAELYHREVERSLGSSHWKDPRWSPRAVPRWANEMLLSEVTRAAALITSNPDWAPADSRDKWQDWTTSVSKGFTELSQESVRLQAALEAHDLVTATQSYQRWGLLMDEWTRLVQAGAGEYDHSFRQTFSLAETRITELRTGLEMILVVVVSLSLLLLWLGERALRPLGELTRLAREITRRGLHKEHKSLLPEISLNRDDEVSQLAREFHHMATALLEREKTVETQKHRLQEQNTLLRRMGELQERLRSSEHMAAVGRMSAQVAHEVRNPLHSIGLEAEMAAELASALGSPQLKQSIASILSGVDRLEKITDNYLRFSRLSAGEKSSIDISALLMSVLATYANQCEAQKVDVDWKSEKSQELRVWGDRDLLEQALGNLMRNALQALEGVREQRARIEWRMGVTESDRVWIRIDDNGPGIPREIQEKLFNPFITTKAQGTGLGLSFVKRVIEEHEGSVSWSNGGALSGACFDMLLPRSYAHLNPKMSVQSFAPSLEEMPNA